ncbi:MAG: hypothetical protein WAU07_05085 [Microgenomates group bacterium]
MTESVSSLRARYPIFQVLNPTWEVLQSAVKVTCFYQTGEHSFTHTLLFSDTSYLKASQLPQNAQLYLSRQLALVELFNYWKLSCSPEIHVAWSMSAQEEGWWHNLLEHGMGEYFFQNSIPFSEPNFIQFLSKEGRAPDVTELFVDKTQPSYLIPVGGGKDSSLTLETIGNYAKKEGYRAATIMVNPSQAAIATAQASPVDTRFVVTRTLDPHLFALNKQGFLNGHIPFSAVLAFIGFTAAVLHDFNAIPISNERSSNEGNVSFQDRTINHQYSKTYAFETSFRDFGAMAFPETPDYFSFLRPFYELQIAQHFAKLPRYHQLFLSCNRNQKLDSWCGVCPKCLFTYTALLPFLGEPKTSELFGTAVLENINLLSLAFELVGQKDNKPFECVGTKEESIVAFYLCKEWFIQHNLPLPQLLQEIDTQILQSEAGLFERSQALLDSWNNHHHLPIDLEILLKAL